MIRNAVLSYVYDFVRILSEKAADDIQDIILFGSVARGDFDMGSDVDIFVNVPSAREKSVEKRALEAQNEFELYSERTWKLRGINLPIRCIVGNLGSARWSELRREIISSGVSLYGPYKEIPKNLKHYFIFSFALGKLEDRESAAVLRKIYGYSTKKGSKTYAHKGILDEAGGTKLSPGVIIVPGAAYRQFVDSFTGSGVQFRIREVWMD